MACMRLVATVLVPAALACGDTSATGGTSTESSETTSGTTSTDDGATSGDGGTSGDGSTSSDGTVSSDGGSDTHTTGGETGTTSTPTITGGTDTSDGTSTDTRSDATTSEGTSTGATTTGGAQCGATQALGEWPPSGYVIHFSAAGEHANLWVSSAAGVAHVTGWLADPGQPIGIPGADIELDSQYNPGYSYRMKPNEITWGDFWIEICDGAPCYVEENLATWIDNPTTWCPWSFTVVDVWDCGSGPPCPHVYP